ncbi:hypothetical protein PsYK624_116670 [Phanerochaete sordida]|uniref:Uncharacterized protein n=1 Tax=Phanerochaete sordida TaxID=48140 RepID=A0A9P3GH24_9APHY|nr:hypothetical protein PsYK624_116670 [Phanerochaete sordida]
MSSAGKSFGTQSPPLSASGQDQPMGVSGMSGTKPQAVPDEQQRQEYFKGDMSKRSDQSVSQSDLPGEKIKQD